MQGLGQVARWWGSDLNDRGFAGYGLDAATIRDLRAWAAAWESDLRSRPAAEPDPVRRPDEPDWDAYLDK
jgi:hypothetical protein